MSSKLVIGVDYGTDSARALVVDVVSGEIISSSEMIYPLWSKGEFCDPVKRIYRQSPEDYLEVLKNILPDAISKAPGDIFDDIIAISFDTTGSTPALVGNNGLPLALEPAFKHNPNAMFVLWKDYSAIREAEMINYYAKKCKVEINLNDTYTFNTGVKDWPFQKIFGDAAGGEDYKIHNKWTDSVGSETKTIIP